MASVLREIKRRKVFQVAAAYAVVAWLLVQVITAVAKPLNLPGWFDTAVMEGSVQYADGRVLVLG